MRGNSRYPPPRRVLVAGADSLVGRALVIGLAARGAEVLETTRRRQTAGAGRLLLDLAEPHATWPELPRVDAAVLCAAVTGFRNCCKDPAATRRVNVEANVALAGALIGKGAHVLFLSSNAVFDSTCPFVRREAPVSPTTEYGRQKADAEAAILGLRGPTAVLRLSKVLDAGGPLLQGWRTRLEAGTPVEAYADMTLAPLTVEFVARLVEAILAARETGIFQASGDEDVTYLDLAKELAGALGRAFTAVAGVATPPGTGPEIRLPFNSLDMSRERATLGIGQPSSRHAIRAAARAAARMPPSALSRAIA